MNTEQVSTFKFCAKSQYRGISLYIANFPNLLVFSAQFIVNNIYVNKSQLKCSPIHVHVPCDYCISNHHFIDTGGVD